MSFRATVSNLPMVDGTNSSLEIARIASDSGGDFGFLSHYIESHLNTYSDQIFQQQPHLMTSYSTGRWRWRIFLYNDLLQHRPIRMEDISQLLFPDGAGTWKQLSYRPLQILLSAALGYQPA